MFDLTTQRLMNVEAALKHAQAINEPYGLESSDLLDDAAFYLIMHHLPLLPEHDDKIRAWRVLYPAGRFCYPVTAQNTAAWRSFLQHAYIEAGNDYKVGISACEHWDDGWVCNLWVRPIGTSGARTAHRLAVES